MIAMSLELAGANELMVAFSKIEEISGDHRAVFQKLEDPVFLAIRKRIDAQGYTPLSPEYAKQKAKKYGGKPILRASDEMYGSFSRGGAGSVTRISQMSGEYGSSNPKALFHHEGLGRNPKRTIIEMTGEDEGRFTSIFVESMNERIRALGFQVS